MTSKDPGQRGEARPESTRTSSAVPRASERERRDWTQGRWPEAPWSDDGAYQQGHGYGAFDDEDDVRARQAPPGGLGIRHGSGIVTSPLPVSFKGRGPRNYVRSDARIREHVCDALTDHERVDASDIQVEVEDANVTLTGSVPEREMKRLAETTAEACRGVQHVTNLLRVRASGRERSAGSA